MNAELVLIVSIGNTCVHPLHPGDDVVSLEVELTELMVHASPSPFFLLESTNISSFWHAEVKAFGSEEGSATYTHRSLGNSKPRESSTVARSRTPMIWIIQLLLHDEETVSPFLNHSS